MIQTTKDKKVVEPDIKEWFIIIDNRQEGPFSLSDLKHDFRFTPDTLVWKQGFQEWIKARFVLEMKNLFKDGPNPQTLHEPNQEKEVESGLGQQAQVTLILQQDPYQFILWILLVLLILFYTFYHFYYNF